MIRKNKKNFFLPCIISILVTCFVIEMFRAGYGYIYAQSLHDINLGRSPQFYSAEVIQYSGIMAFNNGGNIENHTIEIVKTNDSSWDICIDGKCLNTNDIFGSESRFRIISSNFGFKFSILNDKTMGNVYKIIIGINIINNKNDRICDEYIDSNDGMLVLDVSSGGEVVGKYIVCGR